MFTTLVFILLIVALMIFFNALYVGAEFATVGSRRTRVRQMAGNGDPVAIALLPVLEDTRQLDEYVATCQLGITISSLVLGAYGERVIAEYVVEWRLLSVGIASTAVLAVLTLLQVVLGELFPKSIAVLYPERLALLSLYPVRISQFVMKPLIWFFNGSGQLILRLMGYRETASHSFTHSPGEIEILVSESHEGGLLQDDERQLLRNAFRLNDLTARQVMTHRTRLVVGEVSSHTGELLALALQEGLSRIPVYENSVDNIVGFVHIKDAFRLHMAEANSALAPILRQVVYVPEALSAVDVWKKLRRSGNTWRLSLTSTAAQRG
jgi:CBS domain containing-hemolysin-like protein